MFPTPATTRWPRSCVFTRMVLRFTAARRWADGERGIERLGAEFGERGEAGEVPVDHGDATEAANISELQGAAVIEPPPRPDVRIGCAIWDDRSRTRN